MKLSKEDLHHALWYTSRSTSDTFGQAAERLDNNTLEIEGYVRADHFADDSKKVSWTKFDPNDPKTFPPVGGFLYLKNYSGSVAYNVGYRASGETDERFGYVFWEWGMTHWRPLPKPPQTEGLE